MKRNFAPEEETLLTSVHFKVELKVHVFWEEVEEIKRNTAADKALTLMI